jgi:hypothetical protein
MTDPTTTEAMIEDRILEGLAKGVSRYWFFAKNLTQIKPEYLLTVSVAESVIGGFDGVSGLDLALTLEEPTKRILADLPKDSWNTLAKFRRQKQILTRPGKVDIYVQHEAQKRWVIEVKGLDPTRRAVRTDAQRLVELMSFSAGNNRLAGGFLAFPSLTDVSKSHIAIVDRIARAKGLFATPHLRRESTAEDPEDGIPVFYANCIAINRQTLPAGVTPEAANVQHDPTACGTRPA